MDIEHRKKQLRALLARVNVEQWERDDLLGRLDGSTPEQLEKLHDNLLRQLALDVYEQYAEELRNDSRLFTEETAPDVDTILDERVKKAQEEILTQADIEQLRSHIAEMQQSASPVPVPAGAGTVDSHVVVPVPIGENKDQSPASPGQPNQPAPAPPQ